MTCICVISVAFVTARCSVLQCVAVCCSVLQCVTVCYSEWQIRREVCRSVTSMCEMCVSVCNSVLRSLLQRVAVADRFAPVGLYCSVLQCVA